MPAAAGGRANVEDRYPPTPPIPPPAAGMPPAGPASSPPSSSRKKKSKRAKFIATEAAQSRLLLSSDGKLPELALEEGLKVDKREEARSGSNPWLLVAAVAASLIASVLLLFVDTTPRQTDAERKAEARRSIEEYYIGAAAPFAPYQQLLRQALLARAQGDYQTERRCYREVLDMLHAEDKNRYGGLTGAARGPAIPNDEHLRGLLTILLGG